MSFGQLVLAEMSFGQLALAWLIIAVCLLLMLVILLQRGRGGGLAGAFGGGGGGGAFGAKTGDVFTWITVAFGGLFVLLAIVANFVFEPAADASPTAAEAAATFPTDAGTEGTSDGTPITIPLEEGQDVGKIELLGKDGKVVGELDPTTGKPMKIVIPPKPATDTTPPPAENDQPPAEGGDDGGSGSDSSGSDGGESKDPGK